MSGPLSLVLIVAAVSLAALIFWDRSGEEAAPLEGADPPDLESTLGLRAESRDGIASPRSLHAEPTPKRQREKPHRSRKAKRAKSVVPQKHSTSSASGKSARISRARRARRLQIARPTGTHPLIQVRRGAEIAIRNRPAGEVVEVIGERTEFGSPSVLSVVRASGRWFGVSTPAVGNDRLGWVRFDPRRLTLGATSSSIHIDLSQRRATLKFRGRAIHRFPVTIGAPGTRTPTGRYAVTDTFRGGLNPVYGCCAVAISAVQPDLPPDWPGGDRIAIHGNGTGQPLGIEASNGCLRADNGDVSLLVNRVDLGTPVFIN